MDNIKRARKISCIALDVDGTLTDGHIFMGTSGELLKAFNAKDGLAVKLAGQIGYKTVIITGRQSMIVENRAKEMAVSEVRQGIMNKKEVLVELCEKFAIDLSQVAFVGDDVNDLQAMQSVGLACAPRDAAEDIKKIAHLLAKNNGGDGAVREVIEFILRAQGKWKTGVGKLFGCY